MQDAHGVEVLHASRNVHEAEQPRFLQTMKNTCLNHRPPTASMWHLPALSTSLPLQVQHVFMAIPLCD